MKKYTFTCTCGDKITVEAMDKEAAVNMVMEKMQEMGGIEKHMMDKHPGEPMPSMEDAKTMVMDNTVEDMEAGSAEM